MASNKPTSILSKSNGFTSKEIDILDELFNYIISDIINFDLKMEKFTNFLENNKLNNITTDSLILLAKKNNILNIDTQEYNMFCEILTNKKIQEFIFEYNYIDDLKNTKTSMEFNKIYMECKNYIEISENTKRVLNNNNVQTNNIVIMNNQLIDLGPVITSSERVMSRSTNFGGLKTVDFPFNPF